MTALAPYRKSIVAAVLAFTSVVLTAFSTTGSVTASVWVAAAAAAVGSLQLAWIVPNADPVTTAIAGKGQAALVAALEAQAARLGAKVSTVRVSVDPAPSGKHAADADPFAAPPQ